MIIERIEKETGVSTDKLLQIVRSASHRYRTYRISKRTRGYRVINHPTPELKFLQRWLNRNIFSQLPVHDAAFAYKRGVGITNNARLHYKNNYLLKIDFSNFFPSIKRKDVKTVLESHLADKLLDLEEEDIGITLDIVCKQGALTIGAPSSPVLSNVILYDFDCFVSTLCEKEQVTYSRYADDLFMSTNQPNKLAKILTVIRQNLQERSSPKLIINEKKTVFTSRKRRRVATGIVLTSDGLLSIGRDKKREIRTLIYLYSTNKLPPDKVSYLKGYLAFAISIEPEFIARVRQKYGENIISQVMREETIMIKTYERKKG